MSVWTMTGHDGYKDQSHNQNQRDITTQIIISVALGFFAFLAFCFMRPRWTTLYAARKRQKNAASILPELPDTFFGWIPALYRITEDQVLASAGLDAFVVSTFPPKTTADQVSNRIAVPSLLQDGHKVHSNHLLLLTRRPLAYTRTRYWELRSAAPCKLHSQQHDFHWSLWRHVPSAGDCKIWKGY